MGLSKQEIREINAARALVFATLSLFMLFSYVTFNGFDGIAQYNKAKQDEQLVANSDRGEGVLGVDTEPELAVDGPVDVKLRLNNTYPGEGVIELTFDSPTKVVLFESEIKVEGGLEVLDVVCTDSFLCVQKVFNQNSIHIMAVRPEPLNEKLLAGKIAVATVYYNPLQSGELVLNSPDRSVTRLIQKDSLTDLLEGEGESYLPIGRIAE